MNLYTLKMKLKQVRVIYKPYEFLKNMYEQKKDKKKIKLLCEEGSLYSERIQQCLEDSKFNYFYTYGNLLGIIREGEFMEFDNDLDFGVIEDEYFDWEKLDVLMKEIGLTKTREFIYNNKTTEVSYETPKGLNIDFFLYTQEGEKMYTFCYMRYSDVIYHDRTEFTPLKMYFDSIAKTILFKGKTREYRVPEKAEYYLEVAYGKSWRYPDPNWVNFSSKSWTIDKNERANVHLFKSRTRIG